MLDFVFTHSWHSSRDIFALLLGVLDVLAVLNRNPLGHNLLDVLVLALTDGLALLPGLGPVPLRHELLVGPVDLRRDGGRPQVANLSLPIKTLPLTLQLTNLFANILRPNKELYSVLG